MNQIFRTVKKGREIMGWKDSLAGEMSRKKGGASQY